MKNVGLYTVRVPYMDMCVKYKSDVSGFNSISGVNVYGKFVYKKETHHLRKAKLAWMSAFGERETKQTCMRDYMET